MATQNGIGVKIKQLLTDVRAHWNEAPDGRYMPYKEVAGYSVGGIGIKFLAVMATKMILSATSVLIGNTLGVQPLDMYVLYLITVIANIPLSGIRANIIDNTRSREGKYRPYIVKMAIPSAIVTILFVWFPYNEFGALFGEGMIFGREKAYVVTCAVILILNFFQIFFYNFFSEAYTNLIHVLSPNTQERTDVLTIKGVLYSLAPSILDLAMPIFAQLLTNNNIYDIRLYRYIYPPLSIISILFSIMVYVSTKEKIVQARTHVVHIKFMDSLREVIKNKYFWVIAMGGWLGFLETSMSVVLGWLYTYGGICSGAAYSVILFFCQNAGLIGMLIAPFAIRKWGKRFVLIATNCLNIVFISLMLPVVQIIDMTGTSNSFVDTWLPLLLLVVCFWMNNLMNAFGQILSPSIQADIRDYQQYVTGERIDGMFSTITAVGGLITVATSGVVNILYDKFGINEATAQQVISNPDVMNKVLRNGGVVKDIISAADTSSIAYFSLYDADVLQTVLRVLIIASIAGAVINVTPYFFYDLTELKQQGMIRVLKIRAFFEDFGNNALSDKDLIEVVEMVENANGLIKENEAPLSKAEIKAARASKDKEAIKQAKENYKTAVKRNTEIKLAPFVIGEMNRFESELGKMQIADATMICNAGLHGLENTDISLLKKELSDAKKLPRKTEEEKEIRKYKISFCRTRITAAKYYKKYYKSGKAIEKPDDTHMNELFNVEENYDKQEDVLYKKLFEAKERKNKQQIKELNQEIKMLKGKFRALNKQINEEQEFRLSYTRSVKPLLDAQKLLNQFENYSHFNEIKARYDEVKSNA
ncbi:MAG: MFS transporter [Clostridia bacterium]|nr:MFS transporter [Clostridia bacterium]